MATLHTPFTVVLFGATGAVGSFVLNSLLGATKDVLVRIVVRRDVLKKFTSADSTRRIEQYILEDFDAMESIKDQVFSQATAVICCLGTTRHAAGVTGFKKVDYTYTLSAATWAKEKGIASFHLVTASNADSSSFFLYPQIKGQVENAISDLKFLRFWVYRPRLLLTPPRSSSRPLESVAQTVCNVLDSASWFSIHVSAVAHAIVYNVLLELTLPEQEDLREKLPYIPSSFPATIVVDHNAMVNLQKQKLSDALSR